MQHVNTISQGKYWFKFHLYLCQSYKLVRKYIFKMIRLFKKLLSSITSLFLKNIIMLNVLKYLVMAYTAQVYYSVFEYLFQTRWTTKKCWEHLHKHRQKNFKVDTVNCVQLNRRPLHNPPIGLRVYIYTKNISSILQNILHFEEFLQHSAHCRNIGTVKWSIFYTLGFRHEL